MPFSVQRTGQINRQFTALPALLSAVDGLHQLSIPVFVGGRALGPTAHRAALLGADGWAADATGAAELISSVATLAPPAPAMNRLPAFHDLQLLAADWVERAVDELAIQMPAVASNSPELRARTVLDMRHLVESAGISALLHDESLLADQCSWLQGVLTSRGVPTSALARGLQGLLTTEPDAAAATALRPHLQTSLQQVQAMSANPGSVAADAVTESIAGPGGPQTP